MKKFSTRSIRDGDIAEAMVSLHYMKDGWEVFPSQTNSGPIDLVIVNTDTKEVRYIDVKSREVWDRNKTTGQYNNWRVKPSPVQVSLGVRFVYVERSSGTICEDYVH